MFGGGGPEVITCNGCGSKIVFVHDIDDWNRPKEYYQDPDSHVDSKHHCFSRSCYRCKKLVDKWIHLEVWSGSSIGLQKRNQGGYSLCLPCYDNLIMEWM